MITLVSPGDIADVWPTVVPMLEKIRNQSPDSAGWALEDIYRLVEESTCLLALIRDGEAIVGLMGLIILPHGKEKFCEVRLFYHDNPRTDGRQFLDWAREVGRFTGCKALITNAKRPYHRYHPDVYIESYTFRMDID